MKAPNQNAHLKLVSNMAAAPKVSVKKDPKLRRAESEARLEKLLSSMKSEDLDALAKLSLDPEMQPVFLAHLVASEDESKE